jgi:hypothetical protein
MSAPERITAWAWDTDRGHGEWDARDTGGMPYIRADLVESAVKRTLEWAAKSVTFRSDQIAIRPTSPAPIAKLARGE